MNQGKGIRASPRYNETGVERGRDGGGDGGQEGGRGQMGSGTAGSGI